MGEEVEGQMQVNAEHVPGSGVVVLHVVGEVDLCTAPLLDQALAEWLPAPFGAMTVDLCGVSFLSAAGVSVLARATYRADQRQVGLRVVATPRTIVWKVLSLSGLAATVPLHPIPS